MSKIVVVGSLNMDLVVQANRLPVGGETILGKAFHEIPGGKGANQAVAMARLGAAVEMIGRVGQDGFGKSLLSTLAADGVQTDSVTMVEGMSTGVALITVQDSGENSIIVVPGANSCLSAEDLQAYEAQIASAKTVVAQLETPLETVERLFDLAKKNGCYTILNPAPAQALPLSLLGHIDLLTPNETELALLSGMPTETAEEVFSAAQELMSRGVKALVVTLGSEGAVYFDNSGKHCKVSAHKVEAVDTTAAGDSFTAGLAVKLTEGASIEEAMTFATKVGALTVQKLGAQSSLPTLAEVEAFK